MDLGLKGLKAILAGASKGIGRATAQVLAEEGCDISLCSRDKASVDTAVKALSKAGIKAFGASVDMTDEKSYRAWVKQAAEQLGGCDIFISFASGGGGPVSEEAWKAVFDLDVLATYRGVDVALPYLKESKAGSIVAISSTAALEDFLMPQAYNAMKAAVINYAAGMSQHLAPLGVRVNTVSPGPVLIPDGPWDRARIGSREFFDGVVKAIPMGRMGNGEEVARAIAFVASPACRFMTGTNVVLDGGYTRRVQY